jgi:hypothetical protein
LNIGFTGKNCAEPFVPFSLNVCKNNSSCINVNSLPSGFYFKCSASYSGLFCQERVDRCDALNGEDVRVSLNGGICTSLKNTILNVNAEIEKSFLLKSTYLFYNSFQAKLAQEVIHL